jgi:integrase
MAMASLRKRGRNWYYTVVGPDGRRRELRGCSDKRATEQLAAVAEAEAARVRAGLLDPRAARVAEAGRRPIGEHLDDFIAVMTNAGRNPQHVQQTRTYVERILTLGNVVRLGDLTPTTLANALARLKAEGASWAKGRARARGLSARCLASHIVAAKAFSRWAWREGRAHEYALGVVPTPNTQQDRRRVRRPLSEAELRRLLDATRTAPTWRGVTAPDRAWLYTVAAMTGFRRDELASLTPESFRLDDAVPAVVVEAAYTKNHRLAEQPIPPATAAALRPWLATKTPGRPVFGKLPQRTGLMLARDLERAGIAPVDEAERVVDMHSLRHGYVTMLSKAGVPLKMLTTLARHSDPKLTLNCHRPASPPDRPPCPTADPPGVVVGDGGPAVSPHATREEMTWANNAHPYRPMRTNGARSRGGSLDSILASGAARRAPATGSPRSRPASRSAFNEAVGASSTRQSEQTTPRLRGTSQVAGGFSRQAPRSIAGRTTLLVSAAAPSSPACASGLRARTSGTLRSMPTAATPPRSRWRTTSANSGLASASGLPGASSDGSSRPTRMTLYCASLHRVPRDAKPWSKAQSSRPRSGAKNAVAVPAARAHARPVGAPRGPEGAGEQPIAGPDLTARGGADAVSEAIACSVPVISSRISGSIGLLGEEYPGDFPVGDPRALSSTPSGIRRVSHALRSPRPLATPPRIPAVSPTSSDRLVGSPRRRSGMSRSRDGVRRTGSVGVMTLIDSHPPLGVAWSQGSDRRHRQPLPPDFTTSVPFIPRVRPRRGARPCPAPVAGRPRCFSSRPSP